MAPLSMAPLPLLRRLLRGTLLVLLAVTATGGCAPAQPAAGQRGGYAVPKPPARLTASAIEEAVRTAVNEARWRAGRSPLAPDAALARIARAHSGRMAALGFFDHRDPSGALADKRAREAGYGYRRYGENLFRGGLWDTRTTRRTGSEEVVTYQWHTPASLATEVVNGWLGSPPHRRTLLSPDFSHHGIGVATTDEGDVYVTQNLSLPRAR